MTRKKVEVTRGDLNIVKRAVSRGLNDGSPALEEDRKIYTAVVSSAFRDFLAQRLEYMIRQQEGELKNPMSTREMDILSKGAINAFSLLLDWGEEMAKEYASYGPKKEVNQNSPDQGGGSEIISSAL